MRATPKAKAPAPACDPQEHTRGAPRLPAVGDTALDRAAGLFRAVGDVSRLRLIAYLAAHGPTCVTELAQAEGEGLSTISQRLRVLRAEGLVLRRRDGKHINYELTDQHIVELVFNALAHATEGLPAGRMAPLPR